MTVVTPRFGMGASVRRVEDNAFILRDLRSSVTPARIRWAMRDADMQ
ncbi:hypothetical protein [Mesorhizobium sp. 1M-11]|nr:hypothetical protein [Mesorhizobium sp. 1M-11]